MWRDSGIPMEKFNLDAFNRDGSGNMYIKPEAIAEAKKSNLSSLVPSSVDINA